MTAMTFHLNNKNEVKLFEQLAKTLNITFEKRDENDNYNPQFVNKIKEAREEVKNGKTTKVNLDDIWK